MNIENLGYDIGDYVRIKYKNKIRIVRIINIFALQNDEFKYEMGLITYKDLYDRIIVKVEFEDRSKINVFIKDIIGKFDVEKEREEMGVRVRVGTGLGDYIKEDYIKKGDYIKTKKVNTKIVDYVILNDRVVIVTFEDGTTEKAVCSPQDKFDLEKAVEVCVCKKMFGGTKKYNDAINHAIRDIKYVDNRKLKEKEEEERISKQKEKYQKRKLRRLEKKRQEQVNIQAEAFLKAMLEYDDRVAASMMDCPDTVTH